MREIVVLLVDRWSSQIMLSNVSPLCKMLSCLRNLICDARTLLQAGLVLRRGGRADLRHQRRAVGHEEGGAPGLRAADAALVLPLPHARALLAGAGPRGLPGLVRGRHDPPEHLAVVVLLRAVAFLEAVQLPSFPLLAPRVDVEQSVQVAWEERVPPLVGKVQAASAWRDGRRWQLSTSILYVGIRLLQYVHVVQARK